MAKQPRWRLREPLSHIDVIGLALLALTLLISVYVLFGK